MNKYYEDTSSLANSRYAKNEELYKEISKNDLSNYEIKSNATVIGNHKDNIDVEAIKSILDTKYKEAPKRKSIRIPETEEDIVEKEITKEYDINVILEKAKEEKVDNYEDDRLRKVHDTQFDILKELNISEKEQDDSVEEESDDLKKLIDTIALNETKVDSDSPLDILSDLKGSENTEVFEGLKEEINKKESESFLDTNMVNSFYTSSNVLKDKDFEDIDDFSKSIESNNIFIKVIIALIVIIFIIGVAIVIKSVYFS